MGVGKMAIIEYRPKSESAPKYIVLPLGDGVQSLRVKEGNNTTTDDRAISLKNSNNSYVKGLIASSVIKVSDIKSSKIAAMTDTSPVVIAPLFTETGEMNAPPPTQIVQAETVTEPNEERLTAAPTEREKKIASGELEVTRTDDSSASKPPKEQRETLNPLPSTGELIAELPAEQPAAQQAGYRKKSTSRKKSTPTDG